MKILETDRLILRTFNLEDIDTMSVIDQDPAVCQFLPAIGTRDTTEAYIKRSINHYQQHGFSLYALEQKNISALLGFVGLSIPSFEAHFTPAVEIGWRLSSAHWGKGYATEAAKAVLHYAFTQLNLREVVSFTTVKNRASRRVMEKIGLSHDPKDDFDHPKILEGHPIRRHVLYRKVSSQ